MKLEFAISARCIASGEPARGTRTPFDIAWGPHGYRNAPDQLYRGSAEDCSSPPRHYRSGQCARPHALFTRNGRPLTKIYNSGWKAARRRASGRYAKEFGRPCPQGFRSLRVHDLKHTFGHRVRAAGIGFEDRKVLLGHKSDHVTTHYSAPEIGALIAAAERVCKLGSRKSPTLSIVRVRQGTTSDRLVARVGLEPTTSAL